MDSARKSDVTVIIHGGAWAIPDSLSDASRNGVKLAAKEAYRILKEGGTAIDAVESAIVLLENDPAFDAGRGSCLNSAGEIEMDASIMDGTTLKAGAVAAVKDIANPITLARMVMEKTDHCLLVGPGANQFAEECNIRTVDPSTLVTAACRQEWETYQKYKTAVDSLFNNQILSELGHDTVGAVAIDGRGRIAAGTSTGGITGKRVGRVGDSPLIGSGTYCDNAIGGVSCTGHGESIIKVCLAKHIICLMESGMSAQFAVVQALKFMNNRVKGAGGVICISTKGEAAFHFTTERMAWAIATADVLSWGLDPNERNEEKLTE